MQIPLIPSITIPAVLFLTATVSSQTTWTISADPPPGTPGIELISNETGLLRVFAPMPHIRRTDEGFFFATGDSLLPLVTVNDRIPGTDETFDDLEDVPYQSVDDSTVAFLLERERELLCFLASPGKPLRVLRLPEEMTIGTQVIYPGSLRNIEWWHCEERNGTPFLFMNWGDVTIQFIGAEITAAFFSYDGKDVRRILVRDDTLQAPERLIIRTTEGTFNGRQVIYDQQNGRWLLQAVVRPWDTGTNSWGTGGTAILQIARGEVRTVVMEGDSIANVPGGRLATLDLASRPQGTKLWWQPGDEPGRVFLFGVYRINNGDPLEGFFMASNRTVERIASWKKGDAVPGTGGGKLASFIRTVHKGDATLLFVNFTLTHNPRRLYSYATFEDSDADVEEGIVCYQEGTITRVIAQNDTVAPAGREVFTQFTDLSVNPATGEVFFVAATSAHKSHTGLYSLSGGRVTPVIPPGSWFIDRRNPQQKRAVMFTHIQAFRLLTEDVLVFHGRHFDGVEQCYAIRGNSTP